MNSCCEMLVIGLSSRILTKQITNISNVRDIFEVKTGKTKRPVTILPLPNTCCPPSYSFTLGLTLLPESLPFTLWVEKLFPPKAHPSTEQVHPDGLMDPSFTFHLWSCGSHSRYPYLLAKLGIPKCFDLVTT